MFFRRKNRYRDISTSSSGREIEDSVDRQGQKLFHAAFAMMHGDPFESETERLDRYRTAATLFARVVELGDPDLAPASLRSRARCHEELSEPEEASKSYSRAIEWGHPNWTPASEISLGQLLEREGDLKGAEELYARAMRRGHPETDSIWPKSASVELEALLFQNNRKAEIPELRHEARRLGVGAPEDAAMTLGRAMVLEGRKDFSGAVESLQEVANGDSSVKATAAFVLGQILRLDLHDPRRAWEAFQIAIESGDDSISGQALDLQSACAREIEESR